MEQRKQEVSDEQKVREEQEVKDVKIKNNFSNKDCTDTVTIGMVMARMQGLRPRTPTWIRTPPRRTAESKPKSKVISVVEFFDDRQFSHAHSFKGVVTDPEE